MVTSSLNIQNYIEFSVYRQMYNVRILIIKGKGSIVDGTQVERSQLSIDQAEVEKAKL